MDILSVRKKSPSCISAWHSHTSLCNPWGIKLSMNSQSTWGSIREQMCSLITAPLCALYSILVFHRTFVLLNARREQF